MFKRWAIYLKESFHPGVRIVWCCMLSSATFAILRNQYANSLEFNGVTTVIATVNCFLFLLYVRVTDEFKDYEVDCKYFPDRPVPSGQINLRDLSVLKFAIVGVLLSLNLAYPIAFWEFLITWVAFYLMSKWFFLEKQLAGNRMLAVVTHSPIYLFLFNFLIALFLKTNQVPFSWFHNIFITVWIWLPLLAWEFGRKTFAPEEEREGYQTYSQILGPKVAMLITVFLISLHGGMLYLLKDQWRISIMIIALFAAFVLFFAIRNLGFFKKPQAQNNHLRELCELYQVFAYGIICLNLFGNR